MRDEITPIPPAAAEPASATVPAPQPVAGAQEAGTAPPGPSPAPESAIVATARAKSAKGLRALNLWMGSLSEADAGALADARAELFEAAKAADEAKRG